jgi:hypothetical protein
MKKTLITAALLALCGTAGAADIGVSIGINQPGLYGQINLGNIPAPPVIYSTPVVIAPAPVGVVVPQPIYLHVPPGHEKHWEKHCREYNACGRPVYFVQEDWYTREYYPRHYHEDHDRGRHHDEDEDHDHDHGRHHGHHDHDD